MNTTSLLQALGWKHPVTALGVQSEANANGEDYAAASIAWNGMSVVGVYQDKITAQPPENARLEWTVDSDGSVVPKKFIVCGKLVDEQMALAFFQDRSSKCNQVTSFTKLDPTFAPQPPNKSSKL